MRSIKEINIENRPYYFFSDMIKIKNFDPNFLNIYKIWFKSTSAVIYDSYFSININNENPLYLIFSNADG